MQFYFPPMNKLGNQAFRSLCLGLGADFVFTEMIRVEKLLENDEVQLRKASVDKNQINQTIFQILVETDTNLIKKGILKLKELNPQIREINYNMGCPQSSLCKNLNGGGILKNKEKIKQVAQKLFNVCNKENIIPSIKIRIGISKDEITIFDNLKLFEEIGIKKVYIHGRALNDNYSKPASFKEVKKCVEMFPKMEIIHNGDIVGTQNFNKIKDLNLKGVAIGRAALEEPRIFEYLKTGKEFEFEKQGENLNSRKEVILKYLEYAKKYNLNNSYIKANLAYLTKNCIGASKIRFEINQVNNVEEIIKICEKF